MSRFKTLLAVLIVLVVAAGMSAAASAATSPDDPYDVMAFGQAGALRIDVQDDLAAVAYSSAEEYGEALSDGIGLWDVTDPAAPVLLGFFPTTSMAWEIELAGNYLFEARSGVGLVIWDVSVPAAASTIATAAVAGDFAMDVYGDIVYMGDWSPPTLYSIDTSVPTNPVVLDSLTMADGNLSAIAARGASVFVGTRNAGGLLTSVDAGDPSDLSSSDSEPGRIVDAALDTTHLYSAGNDDLGAWDVAAPAAISLDATRANPAGGWSIDVHGERAFLGTYDAEIVVYDVSTAGGPIEERRLPLAARPWDIDAEDGYVWVAAGDAGAVVAKVPTGAGLDVTHGVAGATRYETAIQASRAAFPFGAPAVLIATGENWPDALGGSSLAGALPGPILLTDPDVLQASVLSEIRRLDPEFGYILGGTAAVSAGVEGVLDAELGEASVKRLGGDDRYETAELIAEEVRTQVGDPSVVFVATGRDYPDAVAASPLATTRFVPVFLTEPDGLPVSTRDAIAAHPPAQVLVLGGEAALGPAVATELGDIPGVSTVTRLSGPNRYATASQIAQYGYDEFMLSFDNMALATGESFADALTGGVLQGRQKSVLLLTGSDALPAPTAGRLSAHANEIGRLRYLGGTAAIAQSVRDQAEGLLP